MPKQANRSQYVELDRVFHALSDPTRRAVLTRLCTGPASASELAKPFDMALPSFMQHLSVLESCELVRSEKQGRARIYRLRPQPLKEAEDWIDRQRALWEGRLDRLDQYLKTEMNKPSESRKDKPS